MKVQEDHLAMERLHELLVYFFTSVGLLLVFLSYVSGTNAPIQDILRSFGYSLAPAGVVSLILARFTTKVTEAALREQMDEWRQREIREIGLRLQSGILDTVATVDDKLTQAVRNLKDLVPLMASAAELGVTGVYRTRGQALDAFAPVLESQIQDSLNGKTKRIWIVASTIKGLLETPSALFDSEKLLGRMGSCRCDLRILVTDPNIADLRARQEGRATGDIPSEVLHSVAYLKRNSVERECIRYFPGTPTVFAIATEHKMLLNPYPYRTEAFRCFTLIVQNTQQQDADIFSQYLEYHFEQPWQMGRPVPLHEWEQL